MADPFEKVYGGTPDEIIDYLEGLASQHFDRDLAAMLRESIASTEHVLHDDVRHALQLLAGHIEKQNRR